MLQISATQAMGVAVELTTAMLGENGYGGDVAEIYMYRFMPRSPMFEQWQRDGFPDNGSIQANEGLEVIQAANETLYAVLKWFADTTEAKIVIEQKDGFRKLGKWVRRANFAHRVHVRVRT